MMGYSQERDNTGTNPANFTYDVRFYSEMASFSDPAGSYQTNFLEFRLPLGRDIVKAAGMDNENLVYDLGKKFGARMRFRYRDLNIETPGAPAPLIIQMYPASVTSICAYYGWLMEIRT